MRKRPFVIFGIFALAVGIAVPFWAIAKEGAGTASPESVPASDEEAKVLFAENCGSCHTLARAGTDGVIGPDLDERLGALGEGQESRVLNAIERGFSSDDFTGQMPAGIVRGEQAREIANFVARVSGG